jgi:hypothetical protein
MWLYHWFSKNKGWTPQQVDELTLEQQLWFPIMDDAGNIAQAALSNDD